MHKLHHESTKDTKMDFRYMQADQARISKRAIKEKKTYLGNWKLGK